jgi:hypothetical protein
MSVNCTEARAKGSFPPHVKEAVLKCTTKEDLLRVKQQYNLPASYISHVKYYATINKMKLFYTQAQATKELGLSALNGSNNLFLAQISGMKRDIIISPTSTNE